MHPENIKAELRKRFKTVKGFEEAKGLPADSVRDVLRGRSSLRTAQAIAEALEKPIGTLFPGRFGSTPPDNKSRKRDDQRQNAVAG